jgi:hypothetical protein
MVINLDILCPDQDESPTRKTTESREEPKERSTDSGRRTRLQVININGKVVDVEH